MFLDVQTATDCPPVTQLRDASGGAFNSEIGRCTVGLEDLTSALGVKLRPDDSQIAV
jgi:hypothetical protein